MGLSTRPPTTRDASSRLFHVRRNAYTAISLLSDTYITFFGARAGHETYYAML